MLNALTFDIEDYFQVEAFKDYIDFEDWHHYPSRVVENTQKILDILSERDVKATFFTLGWIAERFPEMITRIAEGGHEIATHGYAHHMVYKQTPEEFEQDLGKSIEVLEGISGCQVIGYRAPTYSIVEESFWAFDTLIKYNMLYDSSIFPITHDRYGVPDGERFPHQIQRANGKTILEFPLSTLRLWKWNFPIAGGGYLRLFPYWLIKFGIQRLNQHQKPGIIYLHPWELDPEQPRIPNLPRLTRIRHYLNLHSTATKLHNLIRDFEFAPVREVLQLTDKVQSRL